MEFSVNYPLKPFQQSGFDKLKRVMAAYPLATLISQQEGFPIVSQVPLLLDASDAMLIGHFDKNNPHCGPILAGGNIYCVFNGPNHYISPTIYPDPQYPGWNYVAVHVKGVVRAVADEARLADILLKTADFNEPKASGYKLLPTQKNFHRFIKMILGFEIDIVDMKGVFKLAQDKGAPHVDIARDYLAEVSQKDVSAFLKELLD